MEHFESLYPANTRENEIAKILGFVKEGNSCQIVSLPGGGRSNLLGLLTYNRNVRLKHLGENQKWFHFVLSNFTEVRKRSLFDTTKFLFLNLVDSIRERGKQEEYQKLQNIFKESLSFNDELVLFQGLKQAIDLLAIEKELAVVFLFDRFEDYIPTVTPEFFTNLRVLRDRAKYRFSVVFSTHKPLEDIIGAEILSDFYQFVAGHIVYLPLFDKDGLDFRISYVEKVSGKKLGKEIIDSILSITAGHPNLTRLAVEMMLETTDVILTRSVAKGKNLRDPSSRQVGTHGDMFDFLLEQKSMKAALYDIWKTLTPAEQKLLTNVILNEVKNLDPSVVSIPQDDKQNNYLQNVGLFKNNKFTIPLFEQFIKKEISQTIPQAKQKIAFDLNTHDITKGELVLSDTLTPSEFKLLRYLVQNPNKIIEREEIINIVWANTKSTAGVTDQALDQLIFRVRKKIEDDPNNPEHLQTVKGRGFRFLP